MTDLRINGVYCASVTPVTSSIAPDHPAFVAHCHRLLEFTLSAAPLRAATTAPAPDRSA